MLDPEQSAKAPLNNNHTGTQFTLPKAIPRLDRTKLRPRLPNLRSPWTSQQTTQESEDSDEQALKIKLSDIKPESVVLKGLLSELALLASLASLLCFASAALLIPHHFPILYSGFMGLWLLIPAWITFGRSEHNTQLFHSIVRCSGFGGVVMALATCFHGNKLPTILTGVAICIFYITSRLFDCQHELHSQVYQLVENEQKRAQTEVDKSIAAYLNKRTTFLGTVSQEIRDAALMVIATLEQFSPTSILANTHELLSACSIAVPIASISAINTTIIQACHISSHLRLVSKMLNQFDSHTIIPKEDRLKSTVREEFDIGELVQNVGDALAGISAKLGVHFVIYHSDNELHYTNVIGDENAIKHALINLLRNILEGCTPGACIEFSLSVSPIPESPLVKVVFDIIQLASPAIPSGLSASTIPNANFTMELLNYIQGEMELEDLGQNKTRVKVSMSMLQGSTGDQKLLLLEKPSQILEKTLSTVQFSNEPTLEELTKFIASLKGVKMILHGPEKSVFAKHLTSCLASWNTDISHVPVLGCSLDDDDTHHGGVNTSSSINTAGSDSDASISTHTSTQSQSAAVASAVANSPMVPENNNLLSALSPRSQTKIPSPAIEEEHIHSIPPAFILIDDDIVTLEKKLREFRDQPVVPPPSTVQKRHRRSKSQQSGAGHSGTVAIVFFASLSNFKRVRDTIHWFGTGPQLPYMPRVIVVPKPAGPRRFLTALHTAWINAIVEPQFIPIATSPQSPFMNKPTNSSNLAGSPHLGDMNSLGGMMTPGGMATAPVNGAPTGGMTPHEISRFSPGRRTAGGPPTASVRTNPLHSPSASQAEAERGNYFFDPTNRPISSSSASPVSAGTPSTTRRKRSQSSARRTLFDISINGNPEQENASPVPVTESTQVQDNVETNTIQEASEQVIPAANVENTKKEEPEKPKSKFNFKISNRKRKDKTQSDKQSPPITVLIVEDNMINQAILSTWMKKHKIKFSVASDGEEAVEKWKGGGFHLILMDIQLPTMDGIQATKMIRDIEKQNKIGVLPENNNEQKQIEEESAFKSPVIIVALTASSLESDRQAALAAGCNDFLTKPVSLEWLEKKIMEWGCMQALIDVEGWRRWRQSTDSSSTSKDSLKAKKAPALLKKATTDENERAILEQRTKDLLKDESKAIVLVGVNKRRMSTFGPEEHKLTKKTSDPDLNSLSIPKQLAARKRLEAQQS